MRRRVQIGEVATVDSDSGASSDAEADVAMEVSMMATSASMHRLKSMHSMRASARAAPSTLDDAEDEEEVKGVSERITVLRNSLNARMRRFLIEYRKTHPPQSLTTSDAESRASGVDLEVLRELKAVFDDDGDAGEKGIVEEEFVETFGQALCPGLGPEQVRCWFRGIDEDCSGRVSWDEIGDFITRTDSAGGGSGLMMASGSAGGPDADKSTHHYMPEAIEGTCHRHAAHYGTVLHTAYVPSTDSLFSAGSDGVVRSWNAGTLEAALAPTHVSNSWIVGVSAISASSRLCVFETNRTVSIYDIVTNRGAAEEDAAASRRRRRDASPSKRNKEGSKAKRKTGEDDDDAIPGTELYRAYACPSAHVSYGPGGQARVQRVVSMKGHVLGDVPAGVVSVPATLMEPCESKLTAADHLQSLSNGELVALAAETGTVDMHLLHPSDSALSPIQSFHVHSQWVSRLQSAPGLDGFYSASTDGSMLLTHAEKGEVLQSLSPQMVGGQRKPIFTFDADDLHCMVAYPMGRKVHVWSSITGVCHATLTEHEATVTQVALNPLQHEVVTLQADKTIKVWDTRMWKVCDTIVDKRTRHPENVLSAIGCVPQRGLLLSASASLIGWRSRAAQEYVDAGIEGPIRANATKPRAGLDGSLGPDGGDMAVSVATATEDASGAAVRHINPIVAAVVAPVSGHIVVLDRKKAIVWSLTDHKPLAQWHWPVPDSMPLAAQLDPAELRLLVGSDEGGIRWLNYCCGHVTRELKHKFPATGVGAIAHLHQAAPPLTAAGVGRHVGLWLDGLSHARPEAPQLSALVPSECGSVVGITWPTGSMPSMGSSLIVATASGTILVYTMSNMAVAFRVPPPEVMGNGEGSFDLVPGLMASAHHNGAIRLLAFERDSLCVSVGYFSGAHTKAETVASSAYLSKRAGWAVGDTCGRISIFRIGDLNAGFRNDKLFSFRRSGQLSEADVVDRHIDLCSCWTAHPGQTVASLAYVEARKELISAGADCAVRVWSVATMRLIAELGGRLDGIPRSFDAGPGSKDFDTHAFTQANGPSAPAGGAKLAVDYNVGVPKPGTATHALLTSALDPPAAPTMTVGHFLLGRRGEFSPGQLPRHAATPHPTAGGARMPRSQPAPDAASPEASPIASRQASPELALTTEPTSKQRARRAFHLPALGGPARRLFSRARTSGGIGCGGMEVESPAIADDDASNTAAAAAGSAGRRRFNRSDLDALEQQHGPPALSEVALGEVASPPPLPPAGRFSPLGRQSPASPRGPASPKSTALGSPAMSPRGNREADDSPRVTSVRERPSAVGMSDLDAQVWQEHDMLCRVSRRTQRLRGDLPSVEAPLVSGTVQAHLGEVARVREGKLHDDTSSLKASHGGGFRGLALPNFTIPKVGAQTKSRERKSL